MDEMQGSSHTIEEAIKRALASGTAVVAKEHIHEFLAQRFSHAMLQAQSDEEALRLKELFQKIIK